MPVGQVGRARLRGGHAAGRRVRRSPAGVVGVLAVAGELDLLEADAPQELQQLEPAAGQRHERPEVVRVLREVGPADVAHRRGTAQRRACRDPDPPRNVALGEGDRAQLPRRDERLARRLRGLRLRSGEHVPRACRARRGRGSTRAGEEPPPADRPLQCLAPTQCVALAPHGLSSPPRRGNRAAGRPPGPVVDATAPQRPGRRTAPSSG